MTCAAQHPERGTHVKGTSRRVRKNADGRGHGISITGPTRHRPQGGLIVFHDYTNPNCPGSPKRSTGISALRADRYPAFSSGEGLSAAKRRTTSASSSPRLDLVPWVAR